MRASERIAALEAGLVEALGTIDALKAYIAAHDLPPLENVPVWSQGLPRQGRQLCAALLAVHPRCADKWSLLDSIPGNDHVADPDRSTNLIAVLIWGVRQVLGRDAILTEKGHGYRAGPELLRLAGRA